MVFDRLYRIFIEFGKYIFMFLEFSIKTALYMYK